MRRPLRVLPLAALIGACGPTSLAPDGFTGTPLFTVPMHVLPPEGGDASGARLGIFWNPQGLAAAESFDALVEQSGNSVDVTLPIDALLAIYLEPPAEVQATAPSGAKFAMGRPTVYADANGNGRRDAGEPVLAESRLVVLVYAPADLSAEDSPTGLALPKGFHLVSQPFCGAAPAPAAADACTVTVGAACGSDDDCGGGGTCLLDRPFPWIGGYCAVREADGACRPAGTTLFQDHDDRSRAFWVQACASDTDCTRGPPYQCDFGRGACLPTRHVLVAAPLAGAKPEPYCFAQSP